eukprot:IDg5080t1
MINFRPCEAAISSTLGIMSRPSPRDVVRMLMKQDPDIKKDIQSARGLTRKDVVHHVFVCPRGGLCKSGGRVVSEKGAGFSNPYKHLKSCISDGDIDHLMEVFERQRAESRVFGAGTPETLVISSTQKEKAMFAYLRLIVLKSLPIGYVTDPIIRSFSKFEVVFSKQKVKSVVFKLTELVEIRIARIMENAQGGIVHDGWTHNGTHFFGVFASFVRHVPVVRNGNETYVKELCLPLLTVSPLPKAASEEGTSDDEAESFDAEAHVRHLITTFKYFKLDVYKWVLCSIADNCPVNKVLARKLGVPHVGCMSHKLNLEVKHMIAVDNSLQRTIDSILTTMTNCKRRLTNRAMLRNLTHLNPITPNATRWSGMSHMLNRFIRIRDELLTVADLDGATVTIDRSNTFHARAQKSAKMLAEIDVVTKELQKNGATLAECRYAVDLLIESVHESQNDAASVLPGIQNGDEGSMSDLEKNACRGLRVAASATNGESLSSAATIAEKLAHGKRRAVEARYRDCGFVLGSAAIVERLWSVGKNIYSENRKSISPVLFESILFLKTNESFWDMELVSEAMHMSESERVASMSMEDSAQASD